MTQIIYDDDTTVVPFLLINNNHTVNNHHQQLHHQGHHQHSSSSGSLFNEEINCSETVLDNDKLIKILQRKPLRTNELFVYGDEFVEEHVLINIDSQQQQQEETIDQFIPIPHKYNRMNAFCKGGILCMNNIDNQVKSIKSTVLDIDENIEKIESGSWHTLFLTSKNRMFAIGKNADSQLNISGTVHSTGYKHILKFCLEDLEIKDIACGKRNSMILTKDGQVYGVGYNIYGQIGCVNDENSVGEDYCRVNSLSKTRIDEKVKLFACGSYHTIMITRTNKVYFCGEMYGDVDIKTPSRLTFFDQLLEENNDYVMFASCGELHSVFLTKLGQVYAFGRNSYGQLGLGDFKSRSEVTLIDKKHFSNQPISMIDCGWNHTLFLTRNNQLYCSGRNKHGQLGLGDYSDRNVPTLINTVNELITSIHAGRACSVFGTKTGNFYITGASYCEKIEGDISVPQRILLPNSFLHSPSFSYQLFTSSKSRTIYLTKKENTRLAWTFIRMKRRLITDFYTDISIIVHNPKKPLTPPPQEVIIL